MNKSMNTTTALTEKQVAEWRRLQQSKGGNSGSPEVCVCLPSGMCDCMSVCYVCAFHYFVFCFCCPLVRDKNVLASLTSSARSEHVKNGFMKDASVYQAICMDNTYSLIPRLNTELPTEDKACSADQ